MDTVTIYGASDDLIEVDGAIEEEFAARMDGAALVTCSDGTALRVVYDDDGIWRVTPVARGAGDLVVTQCAATDDDYTDRATITADHITWVACGHAIATK
jgi:hypothetical protein